MAGGLSLPMTASYAAWLDFRSPEDDESGCWQRRWAVLSQGFLSLFPDDTCTRATGRLRLPATARALAFGDPRSPGRAAKLRGHRPCGLLLELNPLEAEDAGELPCGEFRQLLLFDALEPAALKVWLEKLNSASANARQSPTEFGALPGAVPFDVSPGGYQSPQRGRFFQSGANENNAFDIDDFSDYEDDRHARESSLPALDEKDWTSPTNHPKNRPRRRSGSREDLREAKPRESGATAESGEGATQAPSACVEVACPEEPGAVLECY